MSEVGLLFQTHCACAGSAAAAIPYPVGKASSMTDRQVWQLLTLLSGYRKVV